MMDPEPEWSTKLAQNVHFHGGNFRLNKSSTDNSTNVVSVSNEQLFVHLQEKARSITDVAERNDIVTRLDKLRKAQAKSCSVSPVEPHAIRADVQSCVAV
jgi:hypothetical protein